MAATHSNDYCITLLFLPTFKNSSELKSLEILYLSGVVACSLHSDGRAPDGDALRKHCIN